MDICPLLPWSDVSEGIRDSVCWGSGKSIRPSTKCEQTGLGLQGLCEQVATNMMKEI